MLLATHILLNCDTIILWCACANSLLVRPRDETSMSQTYIPELQSGEPNEPLQNLQYTCTVVGESLFTMIVIMYITVGWLTLSLSCTLIWLPWSSATITVTLHSPDEWSNISHTLIKCAWSDGEKAKWLGKGSSYTWTVSGSPSAWQMGGASKDYFPLQKHFSQ